MSTGLSAEFRSVNLQINDVRELLVKVGGSRQSGTNDSAACTELREALETLVRSTQHVKADVAEAKGDKDKWQRKLNSALEETALLRQEAAKYIVISNDKAAREELFRRPNRGEAAAAASAEERLLSDRDSINRSHALADRVIEQARASMTTLEEDSDTFTKIRNKLSGIDASLGLSTSVMKVIERRDWVDKWIVYVGMVLTLAVLYVSVYYIRPYVRGG